jgi:hypothetical protein
MLCKHRRPTIGHLGRLLRRGAIYTGEWLSGISRQGDQENWCSPMWEVMCARR